MNIGVVSCHSWQFMKKRVPSHAEELKLKHRMSNDIMRRGLETAGSATAAPKNSAT